MIDSTFVDEWIAQHYPHALFYTDASGEVYVGLGVNVNGEECY